MTTKECAAALKVTPQFIRGEILDKRLKAKIFKPEGRQRAKYVIDADDFEAYRDRYWPKSA